MTLAIDSVPDAFVEVYTASGTRLGD